MSEYCTVLPVQELLHEQRTVGLRRDHPASIRKASEFKGVSTGEGVCVSVCVSVCVCVQQTRRGRALHKEGMLRHDHVTWHVQQTANNMTRMEMTTDGMVGEEAAARGLS